MPREVELIGGPLCGERRYWTERFVQHIGGAYLRQETPTGPQYVWRTPSDIADTVERICREAVRNAAAQHEAEQDAKWAKLLRAIRGRG